MARTMSGRWPFPTVPNFRYSVDDEVMMMAMRRMVVMVIMKFPNFRYSEDEVMIMAMMIMVIRIVMMKTGMVMTMMIMVWNVMTECATTTLSSCRNVETKR